MNDQRNLVVTAGFRVIWRGEAYHLIAQGQAFVVNPITKEIEFIQTALINKIDSVGQITSVTLDEVLAEEVYVCAGNDFFTTSPFNIGIMSYLRGGQDETI